jgi:alpha-1,2-mannosyltransferase
MVPLDLSPGKPSWKRPLAIGAAVLFFAAIFVVRIGGDMVDFEVNYQAGLRIRAGEQLYRTSDGHFMFKYFPFSALCYVPFSYLPLGTAKALWYALSVLGSILCFVVSKRLVSGREPLPRYLVALAPIVLAKFYFREMQLGQVNVFVTLLFLWMLIEMLAGRETRAGAVWGLATAVKPYGFIFLPYWVVKGRFRALAGGLAVLGAAFLVPSLFYGMEENVAVHRAWLETLAQSTPAQLNTADNVSIPGFLAKWGLSPALALPIVGFLALVVLTVIVRGREVPRSGVLEVAMLMLLIPLVSPLGWDYQFLTSVLVVTLLARHWHDFGTAGRIVLGANLFVIGFSIYDVMGRSAYRAFMNWSVLTVSFLAVLGVLVTARWRRLC